MVKTFAKGKLCTTVERVVYVVWKMYDFWIAIS